jgi:hypothetical protein
VTPGWVTLGCAAMAILILSVRSGRNWASVLAFLLLAGALGTGGYDGGRIVEATSKLTLFGVHVAGAGWGLYAVVSGAAVGCLALAMDAIIVRARNAQEGVIAFTDLRALAVLLAIFVGGGSIAAAVLEMRGKLRQAERLSSSASTDSGAHSTNPISATTTFAPANEATTDTPTTPGFTPGDQNPNDAHAADCDTTMEIGPQSDCSVPEQVANDVRNHDVTISNDLTFTDTVTDNANYPEDQPGETITFGCRVPDGPGGYYPCASASDPRDWFNFTYPTTTTSSTGGRASGIASTYHR